MLQLRPPRLRRGSPEPPFINHPDNDEMDTGGHRISSPNDDDDTTSFPPGTAAVGFFGWSATCSLQIDRTSDTLFYHFPAESGENFFEIPILPPWGTIYTDSVGRTQSPHATDEKSLIPNPNPSLRRRQLQWRLRRRLSLSPPLHHLLSPILRKLNRITRSAHYSF